MASQGLLFQPLPHGDVEVVPAERRVPAGRPHLDGVPPHLQQGNVERPAPQVVHQHELLLRLSQAVRDGGSHGLADEADGLEPRAPASALHRRPLRPREVRRDPDHRPAHGLPLRPRVGLGGADQLGKHGSQGLLR